jgi:hypothetical protein
MTTHVIFSICNTMKQEAQDGPKSITWFIKTNILYKFEKDWAKNVAPRV